MKRSFVLLLLVATIATATLTGCNTVKAGTRCKAGSAPGRDATHVLFCQKGRWTRTVTIGQAADILLGNLPGKIEPAGVTSTTSLAGGGVADSLRFRATTRNGKPLTNAKVSISWPAVGPGLDPSSPTTAETISDGSVSFPFSVANGVVGDFDLTAKIDGTDLKAVIRISNRPGRTESIRVLSGDQQTVPAGTTLSAPMVVKVTDKFGNPASGRKVVFEYQATLTNPKVVVDTDANGQAALTNVSARTTPGEFKVYATSDNNLLPIASFTHTIVAGSPWSIDVETAASPLTAATGAAFPEALKVRVKDVYGNGVAAGLTVSFTVVPAAGADALLSAASAVTDSTGRAQVTGTAGLVAGDYRVDVATGSATTYVSMRNT